MSIDDVFEQVLEPSFDSRPALRQRQMDVAKIIESLQKILESTEWTMLKTLIFDGMVDSLEKRLKSESEKKELDIPEIYRLNGQLTWARRYADLTKLIDVYKLELNSLRNKLNENDRTTK